MDLIYWYILRIKNIILLIIYLSKFNRKVLNN